MKLYENTQYMEDVRSVAELQLPWNKLQNKSIMLSGATGLIGSFLIDVILEKNISDGLSCTVYALGRNEQKANARFSNFVDDDHLKHWLIRVAINDSKDYVTSTWFRGMRCW